MERGQVFQFRVSAEEKARIVELASAAGVSPSVWVRARALEQALDRSGGHGASVSGVAAPPDTSSAVDRGVAQEPSKGMVTRPVSAPARASEPRPSVLERVVRDTGALPASAFVKPFRPAPKKS